MITPSATDALSETLELFGDISSNLVYITEELPSLQLPKDTEESIVSFCCTFLESLVEGDKQVHRLMTGLQSVQLRAPENAALILEALRLDLWKNVQSLHTLVADFRSRSKDHQEFTLLGVLLNESGANILKDFVKIQDALEGLVREWKQ